MQDATAETETLSKEGAADSRFKEKDVGGKERH